MRPVSVSFNSSAVHEEDGEERVEAILFSSDSIEAMQSATNLRVSNKSFLFFVFMWRHHFPKLEISDPTGVLVSLNIRT